MPVQNVDLQHLKDGDIVVGEPLRWNVYDMHGYLLLSRGHVVESMHMLEELEERGLCVRYDEYDQRHGMVEPEKVSPFQLLEEADIQLGVALAHIQDDRNFSRNIVHLAEKIQQAGHLDKEASIAWILISDMRSYPITHSIHTAVLSEVTAKMLGWPVEKRISLVCAALTMNLAILMLQEKLYAQQESVTPEQARQIRTHPETGAEMLASAGVTDTDWLEGVRQHHEMQDGSGYPQGLRGDAISPIASMVEVADKYCTMVSGRQNHPGLLPNAALRDLFLKRGKTVEPKMTEELIQVMGIYPPGSFVHLANGDIAVVARHGKTAATPVAYSVVGPFGAPLSVYIKRDCSKEKFAIRESLTKERANVKINRYRVWGQE